MPTITPEAEFGSGFEEVDEGQYHFIILESLINPPKPKGGIFDGFHCKLRVLDGTRRDGNHCTEIGKVMTARFAFENPKQTDKGKQFLRQKITNLCIAVGLLKEEDRGSSRSLDYHPGGEIKDAKGDDVDDFKGKQIVAYIKTDPAKGTDKAGNEVEYLNPDIDGIHIYHPRHPSVAHVPKDQNAMQYVDTPPAYAAGNATAAKPHANGSHGNGSPPSQQPAPATVPPADDDFSFLE